MPEIGNAILIRHLAPKNLLSFGPDFPGIELKALNVLIGQNGCGKSNLIEAISLMRSCPKDLRDVTRKGGGVSEWIWKGRPQWPASVEWVVDYPNSPKPIRHEISFQPESQSFRLLDERIEETEPRNTEGQAPYFYYRYQNGNPVLSAKDGGERGLAREYTEPDRSILAHQWDPDTFPELRWLLQKYEKIRLYRDWTIGRKAIFREPQKADMRNDVLEEDFSNLGLVLNRFRSRFPAVKRAILEGLSALYEGIVDFDVSVDGGTVQVFFTEGEYSIPAIRLSDGTLRYLCLLTILCDPDPPPLICIEEPELGLHPDILPGVAGLMRSASERTQLIVTTHSDILVDALSDTPECVVACDRQDGQTTMNRMNAEELKPWLEKYTLGELWVRGGIGGTRW